MNRKKWFLTSAREIWKNFECELTRHWLFDEKRKLRDAPPSKYDFISATHWRNVVKSRLTKEFRKTSIANCMRGLDSKYPEKKSRRGCGRFEQDLIAKKKAEGERVSKISRGELWKLMRSEDDGNVSESAKEISDKIDDLIRRAHEGEFDDAGREDVLQRAFNKKEPNGRVWAAGKGVSQLTYFRSLPSKKDYKDELTEMNARVKRMENEIKVLKNGRAEEKMSDKGHMDESYYDDAAQHITPCTPVDAALNVKKIPHIPQGVTECQLALSEPNYRVVAIGKVHHTGEVAHTVPQREGFMQVGIDIAIEDQAPLPVPNEDVEACSSNKLLVLLYHGLHT